MPNAHKTLESKLNVIASFKRFVSRCKAGIGTRKAKQIMHTEDAESFKRKKL